nr:MAG TPA: hypothetical protein [Caudoviricetes sp.]
MFVGSVGMATAAVIATSGTRKYAGGETEEEKKPNPKKPSIFKRIAMAFRRAIQQQRDVYSSQSMNRERKRQSL